MATSANLPSGAIATNGAGDPFVGPGAGALRYASLDTDQLSVYSSNSPSHAKRALEAHLKDTDRRIQDASRLGTTLLQQRKELSARLEDIKQVQQDNEVPADLRKKLAELERDYNDVGKESARAFLPRSRTAGGSENGSGPAVLTGQARESPSKVSAPSRRQRNQAGTRVHDIEFATEISTSLLAQVRQLQAALAEKDEALQETNSTKAQLEAEAAGMVQRIKYLDDNEQHYKDENWNLEMKIHELEGSLRETTDKHDRVSQSLKSTHTEKTAAQRELDELRVSHDKLSEDQASLKRQQEGDLHTLRRDVANHQMEKHTMQKRIEELTSQNTELAKAVSYRWNQGGQTSDAEVVSAAEDRDEDDVTPENSLPASPVKGTPARGMLESETLKSSLNHAHRMIQNLKNNIHREKTEKIELKRMLQDARDELEARRGDNGNGANVAKKRRSETEASKFKKPARPDRLGANRSSTVEITEDEPDWEDHDGEQTPSKLRFPSTSGGIAAFDYAAFGGAEKTEPDSTDAFETANERDTTETEAFETGHEDLSGDDGDLTETEGGLNRSSTVRVRGVSPLVGVKPRDRRSFQSTASTSADEAEEVRTPVQSQQPKYKLRLNRGNKRSGRVSDIVADSPGLPSPSSSNGTPQGAGQSLGDELDALDEGSVGGTPNRLSLVEPDSPETERQGSLGPETPAKADADAAEENVPEEEHEPEISSPVGSPEHHKPEGEQAETAYQANVAMLAHEFTRKKPTMVDAGVMTEPWEPEKQIVVQHDPLPQQSQKHTLRDRAGELVGGTLAGFGLGRILKDRSHGDEHVEQGAQPEGPLATDKDVDTSMEQPPDATDEASRSMQSPVMAAFPVEDQQRPVPVADDEHQVAAGDVTGKAAEPTAAASLPEREQSPVPVIHENARVAAFDEPKSLSGTMGEPLGAAKYHDELQGSAEPVTLAHASIVSQETEPISPPAEVTTSKLKRVEEAAAKPEVPLAIAAPLAVRAEEQRDFTFSTIDSQAFEPGALPPTPPTPLVPKRSSRRMDALYDDDEPESDLKDEDAREIPGTEAARPGAGFFASAAPSLAAPSLTRTRSQSMPSRRSVTNVEVEQRPHEPQVFGGVREGSSGIPTLVFGGDDESDPDTHVPLDSSLAPGGTSEHSASAESVVPVIKPLQIKKPMADEGSQTMVSGNEIDDMMRNKSRTSSMVTSTTDGAASPARSAGQRRSIDGVAVNDALLGRGPRRPASAGSMRNKGLVIPPPLPEGFTQKITAAQQKPGTAGSATAGTMGPPLMPASAYKNRPKTPVERANDRSSKDGTTPRPIRHRDSRGQVQSPSGVSRRTSVSSFASELDERFNITRGEMMYPSDVIPSTDPRMIQAITQTMIGEYLWKYTRKAGRSETSTTRHRRFFWIHPYTRTLYWSEQDPSTAGKNMLKAKSMAIQSVRVITDDNVNPPGLHRKSIVVVTPGREIVFTAPTGQRHETWFNALSYLLLRTEQEKLEAEDTVNQDDLEEFNPGFSLRRSISRMTGRNRSNSRTSLSSYNSRGTRTSSPQRREAPNSLAQRQSQAALRAKSVTTPTPAPAPAPPATSTMKTDRGSLSGRFSSFTSRFRPPSSQRGSISTARGRSSWNMRGRPEDPSDIYNASVVSDSAEDLRAVIERQEKDADRLENVRACCDGKHDVGSIPRSGRHTSMTSRFGSHGSHAQSHGHAHPRAEPMKDSQRPRRGE